MATASNRVCAAHESAPESAELAGFFGERNLDTMLSDKGFHRNA